MNRPSAIGRRRSLPRSVWLVLLLVTAVAAAWGIPRHPIVREFRYDRMSLEALQKERGDRLDDALLLYHIGRRLNRRQRFAEADPLLRQAVGLRPHEARLRDEWTQALLGSGLTTAAFGQLREFAGTHPDSAEAHLLLGKFYATQRAHSRAIAELEKATALDPSLGEAWLYLADSDSQMDRLGQAREAAAKATERLPGRSEAWLLLAILEARVGRREVARPTFERAAALAPRSADIHREFARFLLESGGEDPDRAVREAKQADTLAPDNAETAIVLGKALLRAGKAAEAVTALEHAARLAPDQPTAPFLLVSALRQLGRADDAVRWETIAGQRQRFVAAERALLDRVRIDPADRATHRQLARLYGLHGNVEGAVQHDAIALRAATDSPRTMVAAANDLVAGGFAREALPLARRAVLVGRNSPDAHEALGNVLLGLGDLRAAADQYARTANMSPKRAAPLTRKLQEAVAWETAHPTPAAAAYRRASQLLTRSFGPKRVSPEIRELAERAVALEPGNAVYLGLLLDIQIALRQNAAARQTAERLLKTEPASAQGHALLGILLLEKASRPQEWAEVESHLAAALSDPAYEPTVRYGQGVLALQRKDGAAAVQELRRAIELDPSADVTYYKLAQALRLVGDTAAADRTMDEFRRRQRAKRDEVTVLGDIAQKPNDPARYGHAIRYYRQRGLPFQAEAIQAEARRRFGRAAKG